MSKPQEPNRTGIARATIADAELIRKIAFASGIDAWTVGGYIDEIKSHNSIVLKAVDDRDGVVGILVARIVPSGDSGNDAELYNIAVLPEHRRIGRGQALLDEFLELLRIEDVRNVWLEVRESNVNALTFYRKNGFECEITRPNFYANPAENAVVMRLGLPGKEGITEP